MKSLVAKHSVELDGHRTSIALEEAFWTLTAMLNDVREQRDKWQAQADRLGSLLTEQGKRAPRWWRWRSLKRDDARLQIADMRGNSAI